MRARQPGFHPDRSIIMIPTCAGPCRLSQYRTLQRLLLEEAGLQDVEILSPSGANGYAVPGVSSLHLLWLAWQGAVGVDLLQKLRHEYRPYECNTGETDRVYQVCLQDLRNAIEAGGGRRAVRAMARAADRFAAIDVDRSQKRVWIGIVGEIYLRANAFTNQDIVRQVEALGGQVWLAPMTEWFFYNAWYVQTISRWMGRVGGWLKAVLMDRVQHFEEARLLKPVQHLLSFPHEPHVSEVLSNARPYFDPLLGSDAPLSIGKSIDFAHRRLCGVINVMPFTCMPSLTVSGLAPAVRTGHNQFPWLDVIYDAQGGTNIHTRLEAFMHQARQFGARFAPSQARG
jgi:predicted nucleotide-binding protein (sugar kinase/HSP70/actin superfamily)